jgi:ribosomal protein L20A (L18A)
MFYTLVTERGYMAHTANADTRHRLEGNISIAKRMRDNENITKYERKLNDWSCGVIENNCDIIASRVKIARRNIELKALEELQTLTILQTAQKIVLDERLAKGKSPSHLLIPRSTWLPDHSAACVAADASLENVVNEHMTDAIASVKVASQDTADMKYVTRARILTRALKFAGLDLKDISDTERRRVVRDRMANPGTVNMMGNALEGITETQQKAKETLETMNSIGIRLVQMLRKADEQQKEYAELARLVNSDLGPAAGDKVHGGSAE